jgi:formate hydrogenlyase subunit 3/multisubunit Na+/H+ antiporter MnhD subunit
MRELEEKQRRLSISRCTPIAFHKTPFADTPGMKATSMLFLLGTATAASYVPLVAWSPDGYGSAPTSFQ